MEKLGIFTKISQKSSPRTWSCFTGSWSWSCLVWTNPSFSHLYLTSWSFATLAFIFTLVSCCLHRRAGSGTILFEIFWLSTHYILWKDWAGKTVYTQLPPLPISPINFLNGFVGWMSGEIGWVLHTIATNNTYRSILNIFFLFWITLVATLPPVSRKKEWKKYRQRNYKRDHEFSKEKNLWHRQAFACSTCFAVDKHELGNSFPRKCSGRNTCVENGHEPACNLFVCIRRIQRVLENRKVPILYWAFSWICARSRKRTLQNGIQPASRFLVLFIRVSIRDFPHPLRRHGWLGTGNMGPKIQFYSWRYSGCVVGRGRCSYLCSHGTAWQRNIPHQSRVCSASPCLANGRPDTDPIRPNTIGNIHRQGRGIFVHSRQPSNSRPIHHPLAANCDHHVPEFGVWTWWPNIHTSQNHPFQPARASLPEFQNVAEVVKWWIPICSVRLAFCFRRFVFHPPSSQKKSMFLLVYSLI